MPTELVIVIATYGGGPGLASTLESLAECHLPETFSGTIVVENGGRHGAETVVKQANPKLNARYLYEEPANKCVALNTALNAVDDGLIVFFDDDVTVLPDTLCAYARAAEGRSGGLFFGGRSDADFEEPPHEWLRAYLPTSVRGAPLRPLPSVIKHPSFGGYNWAAFSNDMKNCGGFNTSLGSVAGGPMGDEHDIQQQLINHEIFGTYVRDAIVRLHVPKEQCSPEWALRRIYREGVALGIRDRARFGRFGLLPALLREIKRYVDRGTIRSMFRRSAIGRYRFRHRCQLFRGFFVGYRIEVKLDIR